MSGLEAQANLTVGSGGAGASPAAGSGQGASFTALEMAQSNAAALQHQHAVLQEMTASLAQLTSSLASPPGGGAGAPGTPAPPGMTNALPPGVISDSSVLLAPATPAGAGGAPFFGAAQFAPELLSAALAVLSPANRAAALALTKSGQLPYPQGHLLKRMNERLLYVQAGTTLFLAAADREAFHLYRGWIGLDRGATLRGVIRDRLLSLEPALHSAKGDKLDRAPQVRHQARREGVLLAASLVDVAVAEEGLVALLADHCEAALAHIQAEIQLLNGSSLNPDWNITASDRAGGDELRAIQVHSGVDVHPKFAKAKREAQKAFAALSKKG